MKRISELACLAFAMVLTTAPMAASAQQIGALYTMTNASTGNVVVALDRDDKGNLLFFKSYFTGGLGTGKGLGNSGALTLSADKRFLFVVNAGSNDVSVFAVGLTGALSLVDRAPSGGLQPVSVTSNQGVISERYIQRRRNICP